MAISSSSPSSGDWSLASLISCRKSHKTQKSHSFFSIPTWNVRAFNIINSSGCPSPILEDQASTNLPVIEVDLKFQELKIPDAENLNEFLCGLFQDPETEAMGHEQYEKAKKISEFRPNKSTLEHVTRYLELKSRQLDLTPLSTQILCESLTKLGKPLEALEIFRSMSKEGISLDSSKIYSVLISSFASIREVKVAEELFEEAETKKMLRNPTVFLRLITMYVEEGSVDKTLEIVKAMKGANIRVSDNICCAVVSGFSRKSRFLTAVKVFEDLISMGCEPGQVTYASIINVYCRLGLHSKAEMVFREMEEKGFDKCVVAYSSMVVMYGKTGRPREAMRLVAKMKERGCKPNVWIYNSLMDMHGRDNNMRQVAKLWSEMKRRKVAPDKVSYTTVIGAYNKAGDFDMCLRFYNEYRTHGGVLDKAMAGMMVGVFSKSGRVDELVKLLRDMKAEGTGLDVRLYRSALNALADSGLEMQVKWLQSSFEVT
ncbi:putative tetratricopeptide-like helical domain-containing protein [Rosa chinensis]|uniref:Putative tetratricopeptide-like helical domain-containing protein n=1 Tax=Rosa chinensis TaxID=74649 RepID=A0A2P6R4K0_ROSCH|nr:putative tetratricopeptide-like helical domain-containing protein [Rosa chinensis]